MLLPGQAVPPPAQDLIDGGGLLQGALSLDHWPHLLHVQHEGIEWLLDMGPFLAAKVVFVLWPNHAWEELMLLLDRK